MWLFYFYYFQRVQIVGHLTLLTQAEIEKWKMGDETMIFKLRRISNLFNTYFFFIVIEESINMPNTS